MLRPELNFDEIDRILSLQERLGIQRKEFCILIPYDGRVKKYLECTWLDNKEGEDA